MKNCWEFLQVYSIYNNKDVTESTKLTLRNNFAASDVADVEDDVKALYKTGNYHLIQCNYTPMHRHF